MGVYADWLSYFRASECACNAGGWREIERMLPFIDGEEGEEGERERESARESERESARESERERERERESERARERESLYDFFSEVLLPRPRFSLLSRMIRIPTHASSPLCSPAPVNSVSRTNSIHPHFSGCSPTRRCSHSGSNLLDNVHSALYRLR